MKRIALIVAVALPVVLILAFASSAMAETAAGPLVAGEVSPHGGYSASTNTCLQCHEPHDAQGDYVLTREATVTATCGTCHGLFGDAAPIPESPGTMRFGWTDAPPDLTQSVLGPTGTYGEPNSPSQPQLPTASSYAAYQKDMRSAPINGDPTNIDAIPGHSLGVMLDGTLVRVTDAIPSGTNPLVGMASGLGTGQFPHAYAAGSDGMPRYSNEAATAYNGTKGLNCASCHTPHGSVDGTDAVNNSTGVAGPDNIPDNAWGQQFIDTASYHKVQSYFLLSSRPNHTTTPVTSFEGFCQSCHDQKALDSGPGDTTHQNHPPFCVSCHGNPSNDPTSLDFPHTSSNPYLLTSNGDGICIGCHTKGSLP